jgi:hypothetical protein
MFYLHSTCIIFLSGDFFFILLKTCDFVSGRIRSVVLIVVQRRREVGAEVVGIRGVRVVEAHRVMRHMKRKVCMLLGLLV